MKRWWVIAFVGLIMILTGFLLFYNFSAPVASPKLTVSFLGFTNDSLGRILRPGDSEVLLVSTPAGAKAWRARFDFWLYKGRIGSGLENWIIAARRALGMKVQDIHQWGAGVSEIITEP
jgi:hypothetical protein